MMDEWEAIAQYEGYSIEEAKLNYAERKDLPSSAFCGPDRSFPAYDAAHVRNALSRLAQNKNLSPVVKAKILACLTRRAKRFGVEINESIIEPTTKEYRDALIDWYLYELGMRN